MHRLARSKPSTDLNTAIEWAYQRPINIRDFKLPEAFCQKNKVKNGGKQTKSNVFQENKQSENFCLRCISKLDNDPNRKKSYGSLKSGDNKREKKRERERERERSNNFPGKFNTTFRWFYVRQNPTKGMSLFRDLLEGFPPYVTGLSSKCHNFFFYLVSVEFGKVC